MATSKQVFIGLMSGTSLDGIDAVLVEFESHSSFNILDTLFTAYPSQLRQKINHCAQNNAFLRCNEDSPLHTELAPIYAEACERLIDKSGVVKTDIIGIANHGQTVKHEPLAKPAYSLQLGDGQILADLLGLTVFTQFRQADLAVGGQGAPLMPAFHSAWLAQQRQNYESVLIVNIGGIANITQLGNTTIGFDSGPGNVLMDQWIEKHLGKRYDHQGEWAESGNANTALLDTLLSDPYFSTPFPKSTGTDYFNVDWLSHKAPKLKQFNAVDVQATLLSLTIESIALEIEKLHSSGVVYVCGGGARNSKLMAQLKQRMPLFKIDSTDSIGVPSDWVEAVGFAWLGYCCHNEIISNIPSVTGAYSEEILGQVFKPRTDTKEI